jgi:D-amino-acid dehydrogenase
VEGTVSRTIVVGAGVIGLACGWELLKRGREVLILDSGAPGAACSSGNAGWVVPAMSAPIPAPGVIGTSLRWMLRRDSPLYIRPRPDPQFAAWLWTFYRHCRSESYRAGLDAVARLNSRTMELFDAWQSEGLRFEMRASGLLFVGLSEQAVTSAVGEIGHLRPYGYATPERLSAAEVRALEPLLTGAVAGGLLLPDERSVRPETLTAALAGAIADGGGAVSTPVTVTGFRRDDGRIGAVQTSEGAIACDEVVVAAGAWSGFLARKCGVPLPVEAGKGYSITIALPDSSACLRRPVDLLEARVACTPFDGAVRFAGTMELSGHNLRLDPARVAAMRRVAQRYLGGLPEGVSEAVWVGMRPMTPDGLPLLGRLPGLGNAWIATGHAMLGVTLAPATAVALADVMTGAAPDDTLRPFSPARFVRTGRQVAAPVAGLG